MPTHGQGADHRHRARSSEGTIITRRPARKWSIAGHPRRGPGKTWLRGVAPIVGAMSYTATVLRIMIASPSDVGEERDAVEAALHGWNASNSKTKKVILQPWRWESSSVPVLGGHPQKLINAQGVDDSDIVFALFGGRLGAPTRDAVSGTVEEIDRADDLGKPVHVYFSTAPVPHNADLEQLGAVREFRGELQKRALYGTFSTTEELTYEVWRAIEHDLASLNLVAPAVPAPKEAGPQFLAQHRQEQVQKLDSKGRPKYSTKYWVEVTNTGNQDAQEVEFLLVGEGHGMRLQQPEGPIALAAGQMWHLPLIKMASANGAVLRVTWAEDGARKKKEFNIA